MYVVLIEPWLGRYENLKETYKRYQRGEDREKLVVELRQHGGRSEDFQVGITHSKSPSSGGMTVTYTEAHLRRDHQALYEAVQLGELSANAAAIEAGFRKRSDRIKIILIYCDHLSGKTGFAGKMVALCGLH